MYFTCSHAFFFFKFCTNFFASADFFKVSISQVSFVFAAEESEATRFKKTEI